MQTPGSQQDLTGAANIVTLRFLYDFDSDGKTDRLETSRNVPFLYQSKITEFYFDQIHGDSRGRIPVTVGQLDGSLNAPLPANVANGTLTLEIYGGSSAAPLVPIQVSQETSLTTESSLGPVNSLGISALEGTSPAAIHRLRSFES